MQPLLLLRGVCVPLNDAPKPDPLAKTKRQIRYYLQHIHELGQMWIAPTAMDDSGGGSYESGAWWETLACMRCDVQRAMHELTNGQRKAFSLVFGIGFTTDEAAELLDVGQRAVQLSIDRGVQRMAEAIGEEW